MRIARFETKDGQIKYGIMENDSVAVIEGSVLDQWKRTNEQISLDDVNLLAPIIAPNMLAIGRNYKEHAAEGGDDVPAAPILFIKATSATQNPGGPVVLPRMAPNEVDYEAELAIVIKTMAKQVSEKDALDYVLGYTCANDVSARDCQLRADVQWSRGKSFDTFAPLGPWIETELDPTDCDICLRLNGKVMQQSNTSMMIFNVPYLVSYLSQCMTLLPGTIILTGTPAGCGFAMDPPVWLKTGDSMEVEIEGIGTLRNSVVIEN